jgi:hypothetical protein
LPPTLLSPPIASNISRTPTFIWSKGTAASYRLRVTDIVTGAVVIDVTVGDTTFLSNRILEAGKIYTWVVSASNAYGSSDWSAEGRFRTGQDVTVAERNGAVPNEFALSQNYPNPFNPATKIEFALPQSSLTTLKVYDLLGRELATLVQDDLAPGRYVVEFDGRDLPSGVYIYRLMANGSVQSRKMQLLR